MRRSLIFLFIASSICVKAQTPGVHDTLSKFINDSSETIDAHWNRLVDENRIPLVFGDSVAFLYRGEAKSIKWFGDFNGWGYDKSFINSGTRITGTDIWYLKTSFPSDARLDYKIVVDDKNWILDPHNPNQQWSGVGGGSPNSELRMSGWKKDPVTIPNPSVPKGKLKRDIILTSKTLGYQVTYSMYTPHHTAEQAAQGLPIVYVTDGYEYLHEEMGNMTVILDNLIASGKIKPVVAVFVDHREPVNRSNNRRMSELAMNQNYLRFFVDELIPLVEQPFKSKVTGNRRAIIGTSMGALTAAYFAFSKPDIFGLAGIQSPAFWFKPEIYTLCDNPGKPPVNIYMTTGTINDAKEGAQKMKSILEKNTCTFQYKEVNQGHSWGLWKDLIDDILIYFFAYN